MNNNLIRIAAIVILSLSGLKSSAQYPYPSIAHNGVESELLARVGNKLFLYDPYARAMYTSDSTNISLLHDFVTSSKLPSLNDYESTTNNLYMSGVLDPGGLYDYYIIYKTDGITLDTLFMYKSSSTIHPVYKDLATYNDTLYFVQRDSLMMADHQGAITNHGKIFGAGWLQTWNDKIVIFEYATSHIDLLIFDTQSQTFTDTIDIVNPNNFSCYHYPVLNDWLLYCDSSLKYIDPVTMDANLIDSTLYYREVIGILNNKIICFAEDKAGLYGGELYEVDITTHQPALIKDINPGTLSSNAYFEGLACQATNYIYFYADDGVHGKELWITDGTPAGTHLTFDYNPGIDGENPDRYGCQHAGFRVSDFAYVIGDTLITGMNPDNSNVLSQFAVTDGTQFYTIDMASANNGNERIKYFTELNGDVYFTTEITPAPWGHLCRFNTSLLTGLSPLNNQVNIDVFPNPIHNYFTIDLKEVHKEVSIKLMNALGKIIDTFSFNSISEAKINLTGDAGVYYVQVIADNNSEMLKIIKY